MNIISPSNSVKNKRKCDGVDGGGGSTAGGFSSAADHGPHHSRGTPPVVNAHHPCYKCSSLTENSARKLTKKRPAELLAHTETQLVRVYPASMRIDSSNFNPLNFWSYGVQMAALNYQSDDATATHVNAAMFERNGRCGYVLKPRVMHDPTHPAFRRFDPLLEDAQDGLRAVRFCVTVVSGQYVSPTGGSRASVYVEIEIIGIPPDSVKKKTKTVYYNSINPVWNETFAYRVLFDELAFVRFLIVDANTNHPLAQRVVPLKDVRYGYRHVDMRTMQNRPLPLTALFICACCAEDVPGTAAEDDGTSSAASLAANTGADGNCGPAPRRKKFYVMVYGVFSDNAYVTLKVTQDSTAEDVIRLALNKRDDRTDDVKSYVLLEEVGLSWDTSTASADNGGDGTQSKEPNTIADNGDDDGDGAGRRHIDNGIGGIDVATDSKNDSGGGGDSKTRRKSEDKIKFKNKFKHKRIGWKNSGEPMFQRVLDYNEKPLEAQSRWQGNGYFVLKKIGDDPSSRAWLISLQSRNKKNDDIDRSWDEIRTFLVCVYNVSVERPYVILKVPTGSTAQDILAQVLVKARRMENPILFILVEELQWSATDIRYRVLDDDEVVYTTQSRWSRLGRFVLEERRASDDRTTVDDGLWASTCWALGALVRATRLHGGIAAINRVWRVSGLPALPSDCMRRPENCRQTVIQEAARAHRKMMADRERMIRETMERGGDGGGGLERGCDDEDTDDGVASTGQFVKSRLFGMWRS